MTLPEIIEINGIKYKKYIEDEKPLVIPKHELDDYFFTHDIFNLSYKDYDTWSRKYTNLGRRAFLDAMQKICDYYQGNPNMWNRKNLIFKIHAQLKKANGRVGQ